MSSLPSASQLSAMKKQKESMQAQLVSANDMMDELERQGKAADADINNAWSQWKAQVHPKMTRDPIVGEDRKPRVLIQLINKDIATLYMKCWELAPGAIQAAKQGLAEVASIHRKLSDVLADVKAFQIPDTITTPAQALTLKLQLDAMAAKATPLLSEAKVAVEAIPKKRDKINPLLSNARKLMGKLLDLVERRQDRLEDRVLVIAKERRLELLRDMKRSLKGFREGAKKAHDSIKAAADAAPGNAKKIADAQAQLNSFKIAFSGEAYGAAPVIATPPQESLRERAVYHAAKTAVYEPAYALSVLLAGTLLAGAAWTAYRERA